MKGLILIADDDVNVCQLLERHLVAQGYHVVTVTDGVQAALKTREILPNLVVLDVQMPGAYGSTVYENLKQDPLTAGIPVLFMSGSLTLEMFEKRIPKNPKIRFLKKPFELKTLDAMVQDLLAGGRNA